ncbi:MAG: PQQ-dependent sugar dehydrogenase [Gammaproteobacteria bacterium]
MRQPIASLILAAVIVISSRVEADAMPDFRVPDGFTVEELIVDVPNARAMTLGDRGTLFVSTRRAGKVYAVRGALGGNPEVVTIIDDLTMPTGIAFHEGDLYIAEIDRLLKIPDVESRLDAPGEPVVVDPALPVKGKLHAWKYIAIGPDDKLYISLGAPCNICDEPDLTVMLRMNADGSEREVYAHGIRNSVGFDWAPDSGELWFTDNGRDMLGDDIPPCELNRISAVGEHFGFPFCHGADVVDPKLGELGSCSESTAPAQELDPHSAPLGMRFYTVDMFPASYRNHVFIAEHGSWNRSKSAGKTGYRVSLVRVDDGRAIAYETFMEGFLVGDDEEVIGRPVDVMVAPDGALLVSDDRRGAIYRVSYDVGAAQRN